jgi:hypothetical protein
MIGQTKFENISVIIVAAFQQRGMKANGGFSEQSQETF